MSPQSAVQLAAFEEAATKQSQIAFEKAKVAGRLQLQPGIALFSSTSTRVTLQVTNPLDSVANVDLALQLRYSQVDATGTLVPDSLGTTARAMAHDMTRWVHGLPAHMTIAPHGTQQLALTLIVPSGVGDGEYWTTLVATTKHAVLDYTTFMHLPPVPQGVSLNLDPEITDIVTTIPLLYRQGALTAGLQLQGLASATRLGDSVVNVCVPLHLTGLAHADGLLRVAVPPSSPNVDTVAATIPVSVYEDMTPCLALDIRSLSPGVHQALIDVTSDRPDFPASAQLPIVPIHTTVAFSIPGAVRDAAQAARVDDTTQDLSDSVFSQVTLTSQLGPLSTQLMAAAATAARLNRTPILDVGAVWCGPCQILNRFMRLRSMRETMRDMYIVHVDADALGDALHELGVETRSLPLLVPLGHDGRPLKERISGLPIENPNDISQVDRPRIEQFFNAARAEFWKNDPSAAK